MTVRRASVTRVSTVVLLSQYNKFMYLHVIVVDLAVESVVVRVGTSSFVDREYYVYGMSERSHTHRRDNFRPVRYSRVCLQ